ncbi:TonB-dependent receptor [Candidatus Manganitrophus noduliformans]|uniref:TonB-dependent siderophore receptor n=1 Tax=Candidatus Manganitrophus noduliformans TaxID=2606439 RepID=A0A7X6DQV6_9BACT|nr:TonB-dependent siderophore receptor [Candidatus Manganitrophus noduliformans]NKE71728.1 TonB-dependent siderophore receptor [Candidatus Manganitrophus noduliformans]
MRQLKRTCRRNRRLAEATAKKRSVKQSPAEIRPRKGRFAQSIVSVIGAAALIGMGTVAWAQQTNEESAVLPEVVVPGQQERDEDSYKPEAPASPKFTQPLVDIPQTVTVIPEAVIEERGATTLRDVLRNVPGISLQAGEGGGGPPADNLSIRGFNARTDLFIDGVRDFGGYFRDPFNISQVEVFKGPASSYAGRGSTGGAINLVSKRPLLDPFYGGTIGIGTDNYKRATLDLNQPLEGLQGTSLRLNALWHDADVPGRDEVTNQRWGVAPSIAFGLDTPTRLTLSYSHLDQDNMPDYGIPWVPAGNSDPVLATYADEAAPVDFSNFYGLKDRDFDEVITDIATAEIAHDFSSSFSLRNLTRYGQTRRDSVTTAPRFADLDPGPATVQGTVINRNLQSRDQTDTILANLTDLTLRFRTGGIDHAVTTGIEYSHETSVNYLRTGPLSQTDLFNPNPDDPYPDSVRRTGAKNDATAKAGAVYLFDTLGLGERWEVTGGLRWDYFDLDYQSRAADGMVTPLERTDRMLSWRAGVVFKPTANGSLYAAYGTSFNPAGEGLTLSSSVTAAANVDTEPEESRTYEIGTKWNLFEERLAFTVALFRTEKTNARTQDPVDPTDVIVLEGKERVDGVELSVAGNVTDQWQLFGGYALMNSEVVESLNAAVVGNELANTPKHSFSLWTTHQLPWNLEVGGGAQFVGDRFSNVNNQRTAPSYWHFDAMVAYRATESLTLRVNGFNLADEEYIQSVGGGHFIPGAGRSAIASADFQF